jgi:hypothetical protein
MRALALERFLVEIAPDSGSGARPRAAKAPLEPSTPAVAAEAIEAQLAQAYERGRAQAAAEAEEILTARLRQELAAAEGKLAAARAAWVEQESGRLAERLESGLREIELAVKNAVARILKPFLLDRVRLAAIESLAATIADVVRHAEGARVEMAGPADLTGAVTERMTALGIGAEVREAPGPDMRVTIGLTALETSLAAWTTRIEEAVP